MAHARVLAAVLLAAALCGGGADAQDALTPKSKNAWVTIFYEAGKNDDEYFLGARVLMQSIKHHGTDADRVVVIANGVREKYSRGFEEDGVMLWWVDNIPSPWVEKTLKRFAFSLNKLRIWEMTKYERVIFLDADVIILQHADFLFNCGHFCAVYFNPVSFHTAILIVKPDQEIFDDMKDRLQKGMGSFDGADQGFINSYFNKFVEAKEWTKEKGKSEDAMNRLPIPYNMHHIYYYERMSWGGPWGPTEGIVTMTFPIAPFLKPWCWWAYPLLDMHLWWNRYRVQIEGWTDYPLEIIKVLMIPVLHMIFLQLRSKLMPKAGGATARTETAQEADAWFAWGPESCKAVGTGFALHFIAMFFAFQLVPQITPPGLAWLLFLGYHALFMFHLAGTGWRYRFGGTLHIDTVHIVLYVAAWLVFFAAEAYPKYPHGGVKFFGLAFALFACTVLDAALYKTVYDYNVRKCERRSGA